MTSSRLRPIIRGKQTRETPAERVFDGIEYAHAVARKMPTRVSDRVLDNAPLPPVIPLVRRLSTMSRRDAALGAPYVER